MWISLFGGVLQLAGALWILPALVVMLHLHNPADPQQRQQALHVRGVGVFIPSSLPLIYNPLRHPIYHSNSRQVRDCLEMAEFLTRQEVDTSRRLVFHRHGCLTWQEVEWCRRVPDTTTTLLVDDVVGDYYQTDGSNILKVEKVDAAKSIWPFRRRNPHEKPTPIRQALLLHPATTLWCLVNLILAFVYWNKRVAVSSVAKMYSRMTGPSCFEIWRSLTGATAHFEAWHLFLNLASLSALGQELEGSLFTSMAFGMYNLSLVVWTSAVWLGLQWWTQQPREEQSPPTVGYSGVLFAWMVVAALEQQVSCPIFFLPDLCFHAFRIGSLTLNWGPFVQLVLMQVLLPRVSFCGHLAGILVGFALVWGILPSMALKPCVALPWLYYLYLRLIRRIHVSPRNGTSNGQEEEQDRSRILPLVTHGIMLGISVLVFGPWSSLTISYLGVVLFAQLACATAAASRVVVTRGFIVTAVMIQVTDAMTCGAWIVAWQQTIHWRQGMVVMAVLLVRGLVLLYSTVVAAAKLEEESGVFYWMLNRTVLQPSKTIADAVSKNAKLTIGNKSLPKEEQGWANLGQGRRLGGSSRRVDGNVSRLV